MKKLLIAGLLVLASCKTINRDALSAWMASDISMTQDLADYRKAASKPVDDLTAHSAKTFDAITNDEETALMAEILADVNADPKKSDGRKQSYALKITAHLNLFHSLKGQ